MTTPKSPATRKRLQSAREQSVYIRMSAPLNLAVRELAASHIRAPERHGAAICLYLPRDGDEAAATRAIVEAAVRANDVAPLRWRTPGVDPSVRGAFAREAAPTY